MILRSEIITGEICGLISSISHDYLSSLQATLDIEDMSFEITIAEWPYDSQGYVKESTKASLIGVGDGVVEQLCFYTKILELYSNVYYSRIYDDAVFKEAVRLIILFAFVHELVHVQQIKNGITLAEYNSFPYWDNPYEKEATSRAAEIISSEGEFAREIVYTYILENERMTNEDAKGLVDLYKSELKG